MMGLARLSPLVKKIIDSRARNMYIQKVCQFAMAFVIGAQMKRALGWMLGFLVPAADSQESIQPIFICRAKLLSCFPSYP